jgi:MFS family permease
VLNFPSKKRPAYFVLGIAVFSLLYKFGAGLHYTLLPVLGERVLPLWLVGLIVGGTSFIQLAADVPVGFLLDRFGYVRIMRIAVIIFIGASLLLIGGITPLTFLATVLLSTLGWLSFGPGVNAYILSHVPVAIVGRAMGLVETFKSTGIVIATIVLPIIVLRAPRTISLTLVSILALAFLALFFVRSKKTVVRHEKKVARHHYYVRRNFLHRVVAAIVRLNPASGMLAVQSFAAAAFYGMVWFVVPLVIAEGLTDGFPSFSLAVFDLAVVLLGSLFGRLADTLNKRVLILIGLLAFAVAGMFLGFNFNLWFLILGFIATAGDELASISLWAWLDSLDRKHAEDGLVAGVINLFEDLGWAVGPIIAGVLYTIVGPSVVIMIGSGFIFLAWLVALFVLRKHKLPAGAVVPFSVPPRKRHKH